MGGGVTDRGQGHQGIFSISWSTTKPTQVGVPNIYMEAASRGLTLAPGQCAGASQGPSWLGWLACGDAAPTQEAGGGHFIFWHSYGETIWAHPWDEISLHSTLNHPVHLLTTILPLINMNDNSHFIASMDQVTICCRIHPSCNYKEKSSTSHRIAWWMFSRRTSCVLLQLLMVNIRAEPLAHVRHSLQWPLGWSFMSPSAFLDSSQPQSNKNGHSSASRGRKILFNVLVTLSH